MAHAAASAPASKPSAQSCESIKTKYWQQEYARWEDWDETQKLQLVDADPHKYVVLRALDLRILGDEQHGRGACFGVAVMKPSFPGAKSIVWISKVGGVSPSPGLRLSFEQPVTAKVEDRAKWKLANDHHAEMILDAQAKKDGFKFIASATTLRPCDRAMYPDLGSYCVDTFAAKKPGIVPQVIRDTNDQFANIAKSIIKAKKFGGWNAVKEQWRKEGEESAKAGKEKAEGKKSGSDKE